MRYVDRPLYNKESVLIPRMGTPGNVLYVNEPFWSGDIMFYTEMKRNNIAKFVFHFVRSKDLVSLNNGSAVPSMTTQIMNGMELSIPDDQQLNTFETLVAPMYKTIQENTKQSKNLAIMHDTILPKLMSEELDGTNIKSKAAKLSFK